MSLSRISSIPLAERGDAVMQNKSRSHPVIKKIQAKRGFTLIETLAALLITVMLSLIVATGISSAANAYRRAVFVSESEVLSSTINTALADLLRFAYNIKEDVTGEGNYYTFDNASYKLYNAHFILETEENSGLTYIAFVHDSGDVDDEGKPVPYSLCSLGAYTSMTITDFQLDYSPETTTFKGSYTLMSRSNTSFKKTIQFTYKSIVE